MIDKHNPLFVDSTKFRGDLIPMHFELRNVLIYEGEELFVAVSDRQGLSRQVEMRITETGFEATVHLAHQSSISFQFIIRRGEVQVFQSGLYSARAQYSLVQKWDPVLEDPSVQSVLGGANEPSIAEGATPWSPRDSIVNVRNIMEKWGL